MEDLERIYMHIPNLKEIDVIYLVVNVFTSGATFADVESSYCRLVNADSNQELGRFELTKLQGNALVFARIERHIKGHWQWVALGTGAAGRTAHEVAAYIDSNPAMNAKPTAYESVAGVSGGPGAKPTKQKPTKSWVAPVLIGATVAGIAAATLIYTQPQLTSDMMGGISGANPMQFMDMSNISMPDNPIPIDLTPPEGIAEAFGDFAGFASEAGGAFIQGAGEMGGTIVSAAGAAAAGIDLSGISAFGGSAFSAVGQGAEQAGGVIGNAASGIDFGGIGAGIGDGIGDGVSGCAGCVTSICDFCTGE